MTGTARAPRRTVQAWVELKADDPEATSAAEVARAHLEAAQGLQSLRRARVFEIRGTLPEPGELEALLHRSIQFYNPAKERCRVRHAAGEPAPLAAGEQAVLVFERDGERRAAAERWWKHETGRKVEVKEGVAWIARFAPDAPAAARLEELTVVRDRQHGLLCNPNFQEWRTAAADVPLPWISGRPRRRGPRATRGRVT